MDNAIEIKGLYKRFGRLAAVSDLDLTVRSGRVTGLLGPNGAGKSTTLRMVLGLIHPDAGTATFAGRRYEDLAHASAHVGAVLEQASFHPGRTGRNHLRVLATVGRHRRGRVDEVLDLVGLDERAANRRVKGYSMGMRQRLAIGAALLGDPEVLILDEPTNGLDPPGIRWVRELVRAQAAAGRAVVISSHLLAEVAQSVDDVAVIADGRLRAAGPLGEVLGDGGEPVAVASTDAHAELASLLAERGGVVEQEPPDTVVAHGLTPDEVGKVAAEHGISLRGLGSRTRSLEDAFMQLVGTGA
jgi:ABC-2 type transport system ATP-binding protein